VREASDRLKGQLGWRSRLGMLSSFVVVALVLAGRSLGAVSPHVVVTEMGPGQTLSISASRQVTDDPIGRIQFFVPAGFMLNSPVSGTLVGSATARVVIRDVNPNEEQPWAGSVVAISPTDPAVASEGTSCDPSQHLATWMIRLKGSGGMFSFPIFIDSTTDTGASFGPYVLVACFRPADLSPTDPNRSPNGVVVDSFTLALRPFSAPTIAGSYVWRSLWTPFAAGSGELNAAATVEAQSITEIPAGQIDILSTKSAIRVHGMRVVLVIIFGRVVVGGEPQGSVLVRLRYGAAATKLVALGRVRTGSDGVYIEVANLSRTRYFQAVADVPAKDLGAAGCQASFSNISCLDATIAASQLVTGPMLVKR
jgi:hypothetical protein